MESFFQEYERQQRIKDEEAEEQIRETLRRVQTRMKSEFRPVPTGDISWPAWVLPFAAGLIAGLVIMWANLAFEKARADLHTFQQLQIEDAQ